MAGTIDGQPATGEPARFGFNVLAGNAPVVIDTAIRSGGDYGVTVSVRNIAETVGFLSAKVTVWGVPGDPIHDMWVRLTIDDAMKVHDAEAVIDRHPYPPCPQAAPSLAALKGHTIAPGWSMQVKRLLGL